MVPNEFPPNKTQLIINTNYITLAALSKIELIQI